MGVRYTNAVGAEKKIDETGKFQDFPGNTIVCNLAGQDDVLEQILWVQREFKNGLSFAHKFAFTPVQSFHMTVFELLCHYNRKQEYWSDQLRLDAPLAEIDAFFAEALAGVDFPERLTMKVDQVARTSLTLSPLDESVRETLVSLRERLAQATGVRFPNHETYRYHVTFAYLWIQLTTEEEEQLETFLQGISRKLVERLKVIAFGRPEYTVFKDMTLFVPYANGARAQL